VRSAHLPPGRPLDDLPQERRDLVLERLPVRSHLFEAPGFDQHQLENHPRGLAGTE
jgi:hypothetical protein